MMRLFLVGCAVTMAVQGFASEPVLYDRDVRPILSDHCFHCHGPNAEDRQADLRLDRADGTDGAYRDEGSGPAIKPRDPEHSALWQRVTSADDDRMPPPDSFKKSLTQAEQQTIKQWITQGAVYTNFWAFASIHQPAVPAVDNHQWSRQPIDRFVLRRLVNEHLSPNDRADRRTLIRRLSLDLTGLPPTREQVGQFLADTSPRAYEELVDRLLASPHYGEHMARYWLDLVRFADTNGIHHDHFRDMSPYRDWVIRALNDNLPYDKFVSYQLAGDLYPKPTHDQLTASGFNRLHLIIDRGTALPEESRFRNVVDRVTAVGTAFLGLTVQCAVCHDHKYDPLTTKEFYQLYAFFDNFDGEPETGPRQGTDFERGLQPPYSSLATGSQERTLAQLSQGVAAAEAHVKKLEAAAKQDKSTKNTNVDADDNAGALAAAKQTLKKAQNAKKAFELSIPMAMVMKERSEPRATHIHVRGGYDNLGDPVQRGTPRFLPPLHAAGDVPTRLDLAKWFVAADHPLTARVAVNRFWQQIFGVGIVTTAEDFGTQGDWPSHPKLLDYLAATFIESGWDIKMLMKQIVMSETYRQSSYAPRERFISDPENRLLARGARFRLDAEVIRDQILATSGLLNPTLYGRSVKPPQPAGLWKTVSMPSSYPRTYQADTGDKIYRRSVYTFWKRGMPPPQMTILDAPTREACIARRERTNTPLQALLLLDESEYLKAARHLAHRVLAEPKKSTTERINTIYETITLQRPSSADAKSYLHLVDDLESTYRQQPSLAESLCQGVTLRADESAAELAAWTMLASTIYNLDITRAHQ